MASVLIGSFFSGMEKDVEPFAIDNNTFSLLYNMQTWRGRARKRRGTLPLGRATRKVSRASGTSPWLFPPLTPTNGNPGTTFNLFAGITPTPSQYASITPKSLSLTFNGFTFTDAIGDGNLTATGTGIVGKVNYASGIVVFSATGTSLTGTYSYYPTLPIVGLPPSRYTADDIRYPDTLVFDTELAFLIDPSNLTIPCASFYKSSQKLVTWGGESHNLFQVENFANATFVTNGRPSNPFVAIQSTTSAGGVTTINATNHGLITGDGVYFTEMGAGAEAINTATIVVTVIDANTFTVVATTTASSGGYFQKLTSNGTGDGIRYFDRDPTNRTGLPADILKGWVNFAPPINNANSSPFRLPLGRYYLVGANAVYSFRDRLIFFDPWLQTANGTAEQISGGILWCWNGTPYYTGFQPPNQTINVGAWHTDVAGRGGYLGVGRGDSIVSVDRNGGVLIVGFMKSKRRLIYTGNDLLPFEFDTINSDYGTAGVLATASLDDGVLAFGSNGITITSQSSTQRADPKIPDEVYRIKAEKNGAKRVHSGRDYDQELIFFTYPTDLTSYDFPDTTLVFNYRDKSWSIYSENYTAHGVVYPSQGYVWSTLPYNNWHEWNIPWASGTGTDLYTQNIAGLPTGYVILTGEGGEEAPTRPISAISVSGSTITITAPNHCLSQADPRIPKGTYIRIRGCQGMANLNDKTFEIVSVPDENTFVIVQEGVSGSYTGGGEFAVLPIPYLSTKQFNQFWSDGKKTRIGVQKYLFDKTSNGAVEVLIDLSETAQVPRNKPPYFPDPNAENLAAVYSNILDTYESPYTNPDAIKQKQIWKRYSQSLIGDTVQISLTIPTTVIVDYDRYVSEFVLHAITFNLYPSGALA